MDGAIHRLLCMHDLASHFGCGLKPELHQLLIDRRPQENDVVRHLDAPLASSGPAHHALSADDIAMRGIAMIGEPMGLAEQKVGADG